MENGKIKNENIVSCQLIVRAMIKNTMIVTGSLKRLKNIAETLD
jgi:hypothetical protein